MGEPTASDRVGTPMGFEDGDRRALIDVEPNGASTGRVRQLEEEQQEQRQSVDEEGGRILARGRSTRAPREPGAATGAAGEGRRDWEKRPDSSVKLVALPRTLDEHAATPRGGITATLATQTRIGTGPAPRWFPPRRHRNGRHRGSASPAATPAAAAATATHAVAQLLPVAKMCCRMARATFRAAATFTAVLAPVLVLTAYAGLWSWRDVFPYHGELFDAAKQCRRVSTGPEEACGSPWTAPCFDRDRCRRGGGGGGYKSGAGDYLLSVYVHDETCSMKRSSDIFTFYRGVAVPLLWNEVAKAFRQIAASRGLLAETPDEACIIFYGVPPAGECVSKTPTWRDGQNHVLLDLNDQSRDARRSLDVKAMFAQSTMRPCYYRQGFDIALPLRARKLYHGLRRIAPLDRKYFATFKGTLYLSGNGMAERRAVLDLSRGKDVAPSAATAGAAGTDAAGVEVYTDISGSKSEGDVGVAPGAPSDVVVVERCHDMHKEQLLSWNKALCESLDREYDRVSYDDLMNATFALLPAGRSPATYRLGEALSAGAIPVFIHQDYVKPFPGLIPWSDFSFSFPAEEAPRILDTLRGVTEKELAQMQVTALSVFDKFFGRGMERVVHTTLDILEDRLAFRARKTRRAR